MRTLLISLVLFILLGTSCYSDILWGVIAELPGGPVETHVAGSDGTLYCKSLFAVYRSNDGGRNWTMMKSGLSEQQTFSLAAARNAFTAEEALFVLEIQDNVILRSTDRGQNWDTVELPPEASNDDIRRIIGQVGGDLYVTIRDVVVREKLYVSQDNGATFTFILDGDSFIDIFESPEGVVYAWGADSLRRRLPSEENWEALELNVNTIRSFAVGADDNLYVIMDNSPFRSTDRGTSWQPVTAGWDNTARGVRLVYTADHGLFAAATNVGNEALFLLAYGEDTWQLLNDNFPTGIITLVQQSDGTLVAGNRLGAMRSTDGGSSWEEHRNGLASMPILKFDRSPAQTFFVGTFSGELFRSRPVGWAQWDRLSLPVRLSGDLPFADVKVTALGTVLVATRRYGLFRSTDNGDTWQQTSGLDTIKMSRPLVETGDGLLFTAVDHNVMRSTNDGEDWSNVGEPLDRRIFDVVPMGEDTLIVGTDDGVWQYTAAGKWRRLALEGFFVGLLVRNPNGYEILAAGQDGDSDFVFLSEDAGTSWEDISIGVVSELQPLILDVSFSASGRIYVATIEGHYRFDAGTLRREFPDDDLLTALRPEPRLDIMAASASGLIYGYNTTIAVSDEPLRNVQDLGVSPNPAVSTIQLSFGIRQPDRVSITMWNGMGQRVAVLTERLLAGGNHAIDLKLPRVANGVYWLRLSSATETTTIPIVIK